MSQPTAPLSNPKPRHDRPKHAACDECRTRKLKCSGEPTSCERCTKVGLTCQYSSQKPMGRPRKRRATSSDDTGPNLDLDIAEPVEYDFSGFELPDSFGTEIPAWAPLEGSATELQALNTAASETNWLRELEDIDWATSASPPPTLPVPGHPPQLPTSPAANSSLTPSSHHHAYSTPSSSLAPDTCTHIPTLLTHFTTLPSLPPTFPLALPPLRRTVTTISHLLSCPFCSPPTPPPTAQQTTLLLATAIPHISTHYTRLLASIDAQASDAPGGVKRLRVGEIGNPALESAHTGGPDCPAGVEVTLQAEVWRGMMRGVVEGEVRALEGVVEKLEERGRRWHEGGEERRRECGVGEVKCFGLTIVEMARMAVEGGGVGAGAGAGGRAQGVS
ncbi:hypothetical protein MMC30_006612 [Trapelia coarctata]|nr:hypothetical protein [Trapelia coarctata]